MFKVIRVSIRERAVVLRHGVPVRFLGPGKHTVWGTGLSVERLDTSKLLFDLVPELRAVIPADAFEEARVGPRMRALLYREGKPIAFLGPGVHRFWTVDAGVHLRVMSIDDDVPELTRDERVLIPAHELCVATVQQNQRGLLYVQGRFEMLLGPGRYAKWSTETEKVIISVIDMRLQQVTIAAQELMTRDKVTLRLTLTAEYVPADPAMLVHTVADVGASLYLIVQLAARDYVAGVTLDELLEGRDAMSQFLAEQTVPRGRELGAEVVRVGVKDIVLPGEMKALLNRVIEAEKQAHANVILRREEAAATRTMANSAKVIAQNPMILKLKELDAYKEIAERIDEVRLFVGADGIQSLMAPSTGDPTKN